MKHKNSHLLVGYWGRLRKGRAVPRQADIEPRAIRRMLPHLFIIDAENASRPTYRLAGTAICERYGRELKGATFLSHWEGNSSRSLQLALRQSLAMKQPLCLSSIAATADGGMVEFETLLAPLSFGSDEPTRFLGAKQLLSDPSPLFGRSIAFERLVGSEVVREGEPLSHNNDLPPPPPAPFNARIAAKAPHLRLVVSQEKPTALPFDPDHLLRRVIEAFDASSDSQLVG